MALIETLTSCNESVRKKIHVNDIRPNHLNQYPMVEIEELAENIKSSRMLQNITVYMNDDGSYTLIGGERRYRATAFLLAKNESDGILEATVIPKPVDIWEEKRLIRSANVHRTVTTEIRMMEIKECLEEYNHLIDIDKRPSGLKRDWIGSQLGISGKTVGRYLAKMHENDEDKEEKPSSDSKTNDEANKKDLFLKNTAENIMRRLGTKAKVTDKKITIYTNGTEDLNRILEQLDLLEASCTEK